MSEEDKKRMINNVKATMAVENFNLTNHCFTTFCCDKLVVCFS